jgi:hypothetical protein
VANERVAERPDDRVAYRLKLPGSRGEAHRITEPMAFMARLAAGAAAATPARAVPRRVRPRRSLAQCGGAGRDARRSWVRDARGVAARSNEGMSRRGRSRSLLRRAVPKAATCSPCPARWPLRSRGDRRRA